MRMEGVLDGEYQEERGFCRGRSEEDVSAILGGEFLRESEAS